MKSMPADHFFLSTGCTYPHAAVAILDRSASAASAVQSSVSLTTTPSCCKLIAVHPC